MTSLPHRCFAITAPGIEAVTAAELRMLAIAPLRTEPGGVEFEATRGQLYAANLELRTASRILVRLAEFPARAFYELERKAARVPWGEILGPGAAVRFRVTSKKSRLYHADAIAERLLAIATGSGERRAGSGTPGGGERDASGGDDEEEGVGADAQLFVVRVHRDIVTISADSSGALLHRRGYRPAGGKAPLRETLAAAMLLAAGYEGRRPLVDPFCGSGTIPIEAALLARRIAPGLGRGFAFQRWPGFDAEQWGALRQRASERVLPSAPSVIVGSDRDAGAIAASEGNAERAGVAADIVFRKSAVSAVEPPPARGFLVSNPPYGIRIGATGDLRDLYARLGALIRDRWDGWTVAILAAGPMPERELALPFTPAWESSNGGIPIRLLIRG